MSRRFQFVWWGWSWAWFIARPPEGAWSGIYSWRVCIGPLELRRWADRRPFPSTTGGDK